MGAGECRVVSRAQRVYVTVTGAVLAGLLVALFFIVPAFGPALPADDLPDRATETPTACPYNQPIGSDGTCGLTYDDIRESEWYTDHP